MNISRSNLFPILPSTIRDSRCQGAARVRTSSTAFPLGASIASAPSYQSQGWTISAHPEGNRYAHRKAQAGMTLVTEARVVDPGVSDQMNSWIAIICDMITEENVHLRETTHLFLEIHEDSGTCNYYFADHVLRTVFWLHTLDTISVGLPDSFSSGHLQHSLEENYWIHVEQFPETASQYSAMALNELNAIFLHARADALTSETLTFPYTANQCDDFIELLQRINVENASSPYVVTYVARLWATVANHRFFTHFGEAHCQLSPDEARFKSDQFVVPSRRPECVSEMVEDLKQTRSWILALLSASIPTIQMTHFNGLVKASLFLCAFDLVVISLLLLQQQRLVSTDTSTSVPYLKDRNTVYGFQPTAIVHSLPQALFVWALLLFSMQGFWMVFADLPLIVILSTLLPVAAILVVMGLGIWLIVRPRTEPIEDAVVQPDIPLPHPAVELKELPTAGSMV
ncbi:hypothetical protein EI94DRAFT_950737 [Lactarius quietus]|nr:hypothetical protein EI94DRAFT_950737 [Lactarius quietus]